jgi:hypothetical protein
VYVVVSLIRYIVSWLLFGVATLQVKKASLKKHKA